MNCCHETQCIFGKLNFVGHYFPLSVPDCSITRAGRMFRTALLRFKRGAADEVTFEIIRRLGSWIYTWSKDGRKLRSRPAGQ